MKSGESVEVTAKVKAVRMRLAFLAALLVIVTSSGWVPGQPRGADLLQGCVLLDMERPTTVIFQTRSGCWVELTATGGAAIPVR